jgi:hypothetical protein
MILAKEAWRTAGRLWIAFEPNGHTLRCDHRAPIRELSSAFDVAACDAALRATSAPLVYAVATCWVRDSAVAARWIFDSTFEVNNLEVILAASPAAIVLDV